MEEFSEITSKYNPGYIDRCFSSMAGLNEFSVTFYQDVGALYDVLTRLVDSSAKRNMLMRSGFGRPCQVPGGGTGKG